MQAGQGGPQVQTRQTRATGRRATRSRRQPPGTERCTHGDDRQAEFESLGDPGAGTSSATTAEEGYRGGRRHPRRPAKGVREAVVNGDRHGNGATGATEGAGPPPQGRRSSFGVGLHQGPALAPAALSGLRPVRPRWLGWGPSLRAVSLYTSCPGRASRHHNSTRHVPTRRCAGGTLQRQLPCDDVSCCGGG